MSSSCPELMVNIILFRWLLLMRSGFKFDGTFNLFFMLHTQLKVMCQYRYRCNARSLKTTICYRCFLKDFKLRKDFWGIANDIWTNYSVVCTPMRHNLEQSQTYSRSPSSVWNLNEPLHFSPM